MSFRRHPDTNPIPPRQVPKFIQPLTTAEKIVKPFHEFFEWANGDPESPSFNSRKTILETLLGIIGFLAINQIVKRFDD